MVPAPQGPPPPPALLPIESTRVILRAFESTDLREVIALRNATDSPGTPDDHAAWLTWTVAGYAELARLYQPPYGDVAVTLRSTGQVIGAVGLVPCLAPFGLLPSFQRPGEPATARYTAEVGLFWAIHPSQQRRGYATEAASALAAQAFRVLQLDRLVATTSQDNRASIAVMQAIGMTIETAPSDQAPPWFQTVGTLRFSPR
jgi:ribosomal-protein-alanine N-acetyltransferase